MNWIRPVACVLLCLWPTVSRAQGLENGKNPWFVRTGLTAAQIVSNNPFVSMPGDSIRWGPNLTVEIGRQTNGDQEWHQLYGVPSYGFGVSLASFSNGVTRCRPTEAYTFFSWPFARLTDRLGVTTDFGMGVSWHWTPFDQATPSEATVLSSDLNARIDWGFYLRYAMGPRTVLYSGVDFTHRSNGGTVQPNMGLNVIGPKVSLQYNLAPVKPIPQVKKPPPFKPSWELVVGGAGGVKNVAARKTPLYRKDFGATVITAAAQRRFYRYGKVAVGTDVTYDGSTGARMDEENTHWRADTGQRFSLGTYGGYEHVIGRFGAILQLGYYVARGFDNPAGSRPYQRFGWRYQISNRVWSTFAIRTKGGRRADALEIGAGYRMHWPRLD